MRTRPTSYIAYCGLICVCFIIGRRRWLRSDIQIKSLINNIEYHHEIEFSAHKPHTSNDDWLRAEKANDTFQWRRIHTQILKVCHTNKAQRHISRSAVGMCVCVFFSMCVGGFCAWVRVSGASSVSVLFACKLHTLSNTQYAFYTRNRDASTRKGTKYTTTTTLHNNARVIPWPQHKWYTNCDGHLWQPVHTTMNVYHFENNINVPYMDNNHQLLSEGNPLVYNCGWKTRCKNSQFIFQQQQTISNLKQSTYIILGIIRCPTSFRATICGCTTVGINIQTNPTYVHGTTRYPPDHHDHTW